MPFWNQTTGIATYEGAPGEIVGSLNSIGNPVSSVFFANEKNSGTDLQGVFEGELKITDYLKATSRFAASKSFTQSRIFNDTRGRWLAADPTRTNADFDQFKAIILPLLTILKTVCHLVNMNPTDIIGTVI